MIKEISTEHLVLDISVNLARLSEFVWPKTRSKELIDIFFNQTEEYIQELLKRGSSKTFAETLNLFLDEFEKLKTPITKENKYDWADTALTWANILQHRAKLA